MNKISIIIFSLFILSLTSCKKDKKVTGSDSYSYDSESFQAKSEKRGVSFGFDLLEDFDVLEPGITWYYNWANVPSAAKEQIAKEKNIEFFPMAWNGNYNAANIKKYKERNPDLQYILAYNEPNLTDQANMTPAQVAEIWPELKQLADEAGLKIISPAMNYGTFPGYHDPIKWLDEFFELVPISDIHGIAIHAYMNAPGAVKSYVERFKKYNLPIWITEFCAWDGGVSSDRTQMEYMSEVFSYFEQDPDVYKYAWFIPRWHQATNEAPYMQLLTKNKNPELTPLGKVFNNFSTFDQNVIYIKGQEIPAEHFRANNVKDNLEIGSGLPPVVKLRPTTDKEGGNLEIYGFTENMWVEYKIGVNKTGRYTFDFRYAAYRGGSYEIYVDGNLEETVEFPSTGEDNIWKNLEVDVDLKGGERIVRIKAVRGNIVLNHFSFN